MDKKRTADSQNFQFANCGKKNKNKKNYFLESLTSLFRIAHCLSASRASTAG
jgi:hypothetical protein